MNSLQQNEHLLKFYKNHLLVSKNTMFKNIFANH